MKVTKLLSLLASFLAASVSPTADTTLITGATLHLGDGQVLAGHQIFVKDGKIEAIGADLKVQAGQVIRLDGQHLYPGFIALGSSLGLVEIEGVRATRDTAEVGEFTPDVRAWIAVNPDSELIAVARANGIVASEATPQGGYVAGLSGIALLDGWTTEQMTLKAPAALHVYWPSHGINPGAKSSARNPAQWKSPEDQDRERKERVLLIDDFFAEAGAYARLADPAPVPPAYQGMIPALRGDIPVAVHADEVRQIQSALRFASEHKLRMVFYGARDAWRVADELAARKVPVVYQHVFSLPARDTDPYDTHFRAPAILAKAGVRLILGPGGQHEAASIRNLPYVAAQAMAFGLSEADALKSITLNPAEVMGIDDRLGSLAPGKIATFFSADGSMFDIRSHVKRLWIAGREISLENRHTRLYDRYRNRPVAK